MSPHFRPFCGAFQRAGALTALLALTGSAGALRAQTAADTTGATPAPAESAPALSAPGPEAAQVITSTSQRPLPLAGDEAAVGLTLEESIRMALRGHGEIGAAEESYISAREGITSARSGLFPDVNASLGYNYSNSNRPSGNGTVITSSRRTSFTSTDISITQNIFDGGQTRARVRQAQARALGAVGGVGNARNGLAYEVAQRFYEQLRQERLTSQRQGQVDLARQQFEQIQAQVEAGVAARSDLQSVQVNLSQARLDLATSQNNYRVATTNFRNAIGLERGPALKLRESEEVIRLAPQPTTPATLNAAGETAAGETAAGETADATPAAEAAAAEAAAAEPTITGQTSAEATAAAEAAAGTTQAVPATAEQTAAEATAGAEAGVIPGRQLPITVATPQPLPDIPALAALDTYVAEARRLRPEIIQARANIAASEQSVELARIQLRPQITASAGYNIDPRDSSDRGFTFGAGVSIPIFDAGGRRADVRASQADLEAGRIRLAQLEKDIDSDVEAAYVDIAGQVDTIANARALVEAARVNLDTAIERYRAGVGIVLDIVNAQTQLFNAETSATQAVYDYELAKSNLDRATGRFAWADPGQPAPESAPATLPAQTGAGR